ncbi:MAG: hypothetical protein ACPGO5_05200 [Patescibacteria group bacterium]
MKQIRQRVSALPMPMSNIIIGMFVILLVGFYLTQINATTKLGLELQELESQAEILNEQQHDLQLEIAEYQSIAHLQERVESLSLISIDSVAYMSVPVPIAVAKR